MSEDVNTPATRYPQSNLAACMLPWTEDFKLDEAVFKSHVRSAIDEGYKCLYVMGTAGEGYALSDDRFRQVVEVFAGLTVKDGLDYSDENTKHIAGEDWHSDVSCDAEPPLGTILQMIEVPQVGGDTLFASMYAAYDSLSGPMQRFLESMTAVHDGEPHYRGRYEEANDDGKTYPRSEHPVVRTHPVSSRKALFVNRIFTTRIVQLARNESDAVLQMLFQHVERPEFQCRFQWEPGSVAFWDNRCVQHHAMWDYYPHRRRGLRVTIKGEKPFYRP